jgi:hypothetical protein
MVPILCAAIGLHARANARPEEHPKSPWNTGVSLIYVSNPRWEGSFYSRWVFRLAYLLSVIREAIAVNTRSHL